MMSSVSHGPVTPSVATVGQVAYPAVNLAIYIPIAISRPAVVLKLWVVEGGIGTGNFDLGLYNSAGTRLVSTGATAKAAIVSLHTVDVTDTTVGPGIYYIAMVADSATDTYEGDNDAAPNYASLGVLTESLGSTALPATASWALNNTLAFYPWIGLSVEATV